MRKFLTVTLISILLLLQINGIASAANFADVDIPVIIDGGGIAYMIPEVNCPLPAEVTIRVDNGRIGHFYITFTEAGEYHYMIRAGFSRNGVEQASDEVFHLTVTVTLRKDGELDSVATINSNRSEGKSDEVRFMETPESTTQPTETTQPSTIPSDSTIPTTIGLGTTTTPPATGPNGSTTPPATGPNDTTKYTTRPYETTTGITRPYETTTMPTTTPPETTTTSRVPRIFRAPKTGDESHLTDYLLIAIASSVGLFGLALLYTMNTKRLIKKD